MGQKAWSRGKRMDEVYLGGIRNRVGYCTTCINMTPTVNAIITPSIITMDAFFVSRITAAVIEIIAIAAINDAGAITQGMSCANITRDCI
jgi:ABC-type enterochelin transport system permease subunit